MNFKTYKELADQFKLGNITTETFHPKSKNLSTDSKSNLKKALNDLKSIDSEAFAILNSKKEFLYKIYNQIKSANTPKSRIFLCGCGATGRLSLAIETIAIQLGIRNIKSFMAGGDYALIKSVESFEDRAEYGKRQLQDFNFNQNDTLLAITEGGETSFVIGAAIYASEVSKNKTYFLYCNPDEDLMHLDRCRSIFENIRIEKVNLTVGAMSLSGSTRMQASTIQMFVAGLLLLKNFDSFEDFSLYIDDSLFQFSNLNYQGLEGLITEESNCYRTNKIVTYISDANLAISVLTDTTERSPTFNLEPFESIDNIKYSLCYLAVAGAKSSKGAWKSLLGRELRDLDWGSKFSSINIDSILSFDISENSISRRDNITSNECFSILELKNGFKLSFRNIIQVYEFAQSDPLIKHIALKVLLNTHSTLVMGRLDRFESNIMTWVRPSNYKLIDRASRYAQRLLELKGHEVDYDLVLEYVYNSQDRFANSEQSIVLYTVAHFMNS